MNSNNEYDGLLIRYLLNEETETERVFIEDWLNADEKNRAYFNQLVKVWQLTGLKQDLDFLTNEVNLEAKWNNLEASMSTERTESISGEENQLANREYTDDSAPVVRSLRYKWLVAVSIAASILLVISFGWKFLGTNKVVESPIVQNNSKEIDRPLFTIKREVNSTGKDRQLTLPDGSQITLANNSELSYTLPFTTQRNIDLTGKAFFKVAKDKTKPFTVTSGSIATTALGTQFTVTAYENASQLTVHLYEGKVAIRTATSTKEKAKHLAYLNPGEQFIYNSDGTCKIIKFGSNNKNQTIAGKDEDNDVLMMPSNTKGTWYMFNNQLLPDVLDQLADIYSVKIVYDKRSIGNIYFTGKYEKGDSLETILKELATLHNLKITNEGNVYTIAR